MFSIPSLFAQVAIPDASAAHVAVADAADRYRLAQWESFTEWWQAPVLVLIGLAVIAFVVIMYRRDSVELRPGVGVLLAALRITAFVGLLLAYLNLQKWSEQKEIQKSRALVLVDTSISMALADADASAGAPSAASAIAGVDPRSRIGQIITEFSGGQFLSELRKTHDVSVFRFDERLGRVTFLPKLSDAVVAAQTGADAAAARETQVMWLRYLFYAGLVLLGLSALGWIVRRMARARGGGWASALGLTLGGLLAFGAAAALNLSHPDDDFLGLIGLREPLPPDAADAQAKKAAEDKKKAEEKPEEKVDWVAALQAVGTETRIGESLRQLINDERAQPISCVVLLTDGGQNAGLDPSAAVEAAQEAHIPVFAVGFGSDRRPVSVRIADFAVPVRVYPGDNYKVTVDVEAQGLAGREVVLELYSRQAGKLQGTNAKGWNNEKVQSVILPTDGHKERVTFELPGTKIVGRRTLQLRVKPPAGSHGGEVAKEQTQEADVEIVDRKNRVLLLAGGPTREYQFLRNQLRRDKDTIVDVFLQTAANGVSQDAHQILDHFPSTMQEISQYDAIVAFDPNWLALDPDPAANLDRIRLLERWVSEESGGLILMAGPVNTDEWIADRKMGQFGKLRALYPVEFDALLAKPGEPKFGADEPGPLEFTPAGKQSEFLWLGTSAAVSFETWNQFKGVYGYYPPIRRVKPGATVYAHYAPKSFATGGDLPIYMAGQLYGSGRVFYIGSSEMWRLRALEEAYFEQFYTKLLRYVSQGRMLRGSRRGSLAVDRDTYLLGSTVDIEARLTDVQHQPLALAKVAAEVTPQDGPPLSVPLLADPNRKGSYRGQFVALLPGQYRIELNIPDSKEEPLSRQIMVKVPDLEKLNPQRNDALLNDITSRTGGEYYVGLPAALGAKGMPPLAGRLKDQTRLTLKSGDRDSKWEERWLTWLLCGICGVLCFEWLIRRLSRLA